MLLGNLAVNLTTNSMRTGLAEISGRLGVTKVYGEIEGLATQAILRMLEHETLCVFSDFRSLNSSGPLRLMILRRSAS